MQELRLELLLGRPVRDRDDRMLGYLVEVKAEQRPAGVCEVSEFLVSRVSILQRLIGSTVGTALQELLGRNHFYCVPWQQLDISNPRYPRVLCGMSELRTESVEIE